MGGEEFFVCHREITDDRGRVESYEFVDLSPEMEKALGREIKGLTLEEVDFKIMGVKIPWGEILREVSQKGTLRKELKAEDSSLTLRLLSGKTRCGHYFSVLHNISGEKAQQVTLQTLLKQAKRFLEMSAGEVDYGALVEELKEISGAGVVILNVFDGERQKAFTRGVAIEGFSSKDLEKILGFKLEEVEWDLIPEKLSQQRNQGLVAYESIEQAVFGQLSEEVIERIEEKFSPGKVYAVEIERSGELLGEFMLFTFSGEYLHNPPAVEAYARQAGLIMAQKETERELNRSREEKQLILENLVERISFMDCDLNIIWTNHKQPGEKVEGEKCYAIRHGREKPCPDCRVLRAIESGETIVEEQENSEGRCWQVSGTPVRDKNGEIIGAIESIFEITERKEMERRLEEEKNRFSYILETTPAVVYTLQPEGKDFSLYTSYISSNINELWGYDSELFLQDKNFFWECIHPEDRERVKKTYNLLKERGRAVIEYRFKDSSGEYRWVHDEAILFRKEGGEIGEIVGSRFDVSDRYEMYLQVEQKASEQQLLLDNIDIQVWYLIDPETYGAVNEAHGRFLGQKKEELAYQKIKDSWISEDPEGFVEKNSLVFSRKEKMTLERWVKNARGEERLLQTTRIPKLDKNGEVDFVVCWAEDITELKEKERELRQQSELLEGILDAIPDMISIQSQDYTVERYNKKGYETIGLTPEEAAGVKCFENLGRQKPCPQCPTQKALETGELVEAEKFNPLEKTYQNIRSNPIKDEEGNISHIVKQVRDITEEKNQEVRMLQERDYMFRIFDSMRQLVLVIETDYRIKFMNRVAREELGDFIGTVCYEAFEEEGPCSQCLIEELSQPSQTSPLQFTVEIWGRVYEGTATVLHNLDGTKSILEVLQDVTERKKAEAEIRFLSFHDSLTGLYNRAFIEEEMNRLSRTEKLPISAVMVDINGLKMVNDSYGHQKGDELLKKAARAIEDNCRTGDIVGRWGGDEFIVLLPGTPKEQADEIGERIKESCTGIHIEDIPISMALGTASKTIKEDDLNEIIVQAEQEMYKNKLAESQSVRNNVLTTLLKALGEKSDETEEHMLRMQNLAYRLGRKLNLPYSELERLTLLVSLHDIGKIAIDEQILTKPGALSEKEWEIVKEHPETGYRLATSTGEFAHVAKEILAHHENWNGTGYPQGLMGTQIPLLARIVSLIDAYDVMTNGRPYKKPLSSEEALQEIERCSGTQFDPELAGIFVKMIQEEGEEREF